VAAPRSNSTSRPSKKSSLPTGEGVVVDIGTGDGLFVYQSARQNPKKFYIGIDPATGPLRKISEKIHRKPPKGGLPNLLFLRSAVEDLPRELDGVADEVHVHFPWGSLLRAVATGDLQVLGKLRRICSADALVEIVIGIDPDRDRSEMNRLGLESVSAAYVDSVLVPKYGRAGLEIVERDEISASEWPRLRTSWAKRLKVSPRRSLTYLVARAK
jgi:16S rRNA (adenine(1408)-N(1))-methyltransferase